MVDITPEWNLIPMKDKIVIPPSFNDNMGQSVGNLKSSPNETSIGEGNSVFKATKDGIYLGNTAFASAPFRVSMAGALTATSATITGTITATSGAIGGFDIGSDYIRDAGNTFGLASTVTAGDDVRFWAGDTFANRATAPLRITEAGAITATTAVITGALTAAAGSVIATTYLSGLVAQTNLNIANQGWTQTCVFSSTDLDTVSWGAGTLTTAGGTTYNIGAGNTGNMAARTYIYIDIAISTTAYQTTTTAATAVGTGKIMVATAINGAVEAEFQVFNGVGGLNLNASNIVSGSLTANEIADLAITGAKIAASTITAAKIAVGTITGNEIAATTITAANIAAGTITATQILANTITANEIAANTITSGQLTTGAFVTTTANITDGIITNAKVSDLAVSKLTAGSITSKAISLGIAAGTGDCYISGGLNLDYTNWTADKGFILGLDDSDSDLAKFFIGDNANSKYFKFDGTNSDATGLRYIEVFTAGEDITSGNVVCLKPGYVDIDASANAYVWSQAGQENNNFGNPANVYCDQSNSNQWGFLKWDLTTCPTGTDIIKAELILTRQAGAGGTITVTRVSSADWGEMTITWNNQPTTTQDIQTTYASQETATPASVITLDVTQFVRQWKDGLVNNYGIRVIDATGSIYKIYGRSSGSQSLRPRLRIWSSYSGTATLNKASDNDYLLCRSIAGIALETITSGNPIKVQTAGQAAITCTGGGKLYLTQGGATSESSVNCNRMILLGKSTAANKLLLSPQEQDKFIEKPYALMNLDDGGVGISIVAPDDARYIKLILYASTVNRYFEMNVFRGAVENNDTTNYRYWDGNANGWTVTWTGSVVSISSDGTGTLRNYFFYT